MKQQFIWKKILISSCTYKFQSKVLMKHELIRNCATVSTSKWSPKHSTIIETLTNLKIRRWFVVGWVESCHVNVLAISSNCKIWHWWKHQNISLRNFWYNKQKLYIHFTNKQTAKHEAHVSLLDICVKLWQASLSFKLCRNLSIRAVHIYHFLSAFLWPICFEETMVKLNV